MSWENNFLGTYGIPVKKMRIISDRVKDPRVPLFYLHEKSGSIKKIVMKFFKEIPLDENEFNILKWYVCQWIEKMEPFFSNRDRFETTCTRMNKMGMEKFRKFVNSLVALGIDPF